MISFFEELEDMECLQGDTLPAFYVQTDIPYADRANYYMVLILESDNLGDAGTRKVQKDCSVSLWMDGSEEKTRFSAQLTSDDTRSLSGSYVMHFRMTDENNLEYAKIAGQLYVRKTAQKAGA